MDVQVFRGDLENADSLREAASASDGVIHLAFMHGLSKASLARRLHVFFGGRPGGIVTRFLAVTTEADRRAIEALAEGLEGSGRPLVTTFGTLGLASGGPRRSVPFAESDGPDPRSPGFGRATTESTVEAWAARGVRASIVRLPPSVHGDGDAGFVPQLVRAARQKKCAAYVGDGRNRWPAVHRLDAARLFRLALEHGEAGARYHGVAEEGIAFRDIAGVIGRRLGLPMASCEAAQASAHFGWLAPLVSLDNPASSALTRERLGWQPREAGLLADIDRASYFAS
jgi:nucleoside-diphosphate-sugar epimerase